VIPARERLGTHDAAGPQVCLGLVIELDLTLVDRRAHPAREREAPRRVAVELGLEDRVATAGVLGRVHRDIGALLQRLVVIAVDRVQRDADAGVDLQAHALKHKRLAQMHEQALGDAGRVRRAVDVWEQDPKLVAAEAGDRVGVAQRALQPPSDLL
jgi:hypothetical protein